VIHVVISHSSVIGILPVKHIRGQMFVSFTYGDEYFLDAMSVITRMFSYQYQVERVKMEGQ